MTVGQLQDLLITLLLQCTIMTLVESVTSCSSCMADVYGPYPENQSIQYDVQVVRATESNPAIIVCRYVCYDHGRYNFELVISILDPQNQRQSHEPILGSQEYQDHEHNFRVVPIISEICDQENNETIKKYRIHVGSSDVPTLLAKCFVRHSPNFPSHAGSSRCSNSSTLAIMPGYSAPENCTMPYIMPTKAVSLSPSPSTVSDH